jgi:hypothetical protein
MKLHFHPIIQAVLHIINQIVEILLTINVRFF